MIRHLRLVSALAILGLGAACASVENPATGESQFTTMSLEDERRVGASEHPKILAQFGGEIENAFLKDYINQVGARLAAQAELPADQFTFTVLDTPVVNAFALPGGYVYITRGLLAVLNTEAEVAGVLGHEIGHITARHGATRQTRGVFANLAVIGAAILTGSREVAQLGQVAAAGYLASYSRDQERQSDSLGIRYLNRAGYEPLGMSDGLKALGRQGKLLARISGNEGQQYSFLSTHPQTPERVRATEQEARSVQTGPNAEIGRDAFLDAIDGMIYGDSPKQGFARGQEFSHPILKFTFRVPDGFRMSNLPQAVVANTQDGKARIVFDQEPDNRVATSGLRMDDYIAGQWARGARLFDLDQITVDGMPAATAVAQVNANGQRLDARLVAIRFDRKTIYRFMFVTGTRDTRSFSRAFRNTTFSFRRLSDREAARLEPQRLQVVTVRAGDSVNRLSQFDEQDGFEDDRFRVINAMSNNNLIAGAAVKIIR